MLSLVLRISVSLMSVLILTANALAFPDRSVPDWLWLYYIPITFSLHVGAIASGILVIIIGVLDRKRDSNRLDLSVSLMFILGVLFIIAGPWLIDRYSDYLVDEGAIDYVVIGFSSTASITWLVIATYPLWSPKARRAKAELVDTFT